MRFARGMLAPVAAGALSLFAISAVLVPATVRAQATKPSDATVPAINLTPEEIAEKEGRKACKVQICAAFRLKKPGPDIACNVVKTWRKKQLDVYMSKARASWPWGKVRCTSDINIKRDMIIKAMTEASYEIQLDEHQVKCTVDGEKGPSELKFAFKPTVKFENGKAVKAAIHWGKIEAPTLVKGAMWTATAADNTFNVLQSSVVGDINDFVTARCDEVKADWEKK